MLILSAGILLLSVVAAWLFRTLAQNRLAEASLRNHWMMLACVVTAVGIGQFLYVSVFQVTAVAGALISLMFASVVLMSAVQLVRTINYIGEVSCINGVNIMDSTTGVYNQTYLEQRLDNEVARCHRYGSPLSIVSLSVDGFSSLQEEFGHQAGALALKKIADKLVALLRETDVVTFVGDGRFILLLPDTPEINVDGLITRLRGSLNGMEVINGAEKERSLFINVNFGKSHCSLQTGSGAELIERVLAAEMPQNMPLSQAA